MSDRRKISEFDRTYVLERGLFVPKKPSIRRFTATAFPFGTVAGAGATAPPVFVAATVGSGSSGTVSGVAIPTGTTDGDTLYAFVAANASGRTLTGTGWTRIFLDTSAKPSVAIFKKTAASESGTYLFSGGGTGNDMAANIVCYRGGAGAEDTIGTLTRSGTAIAAAASITPAAAGVLLAYSLCTDDAATTLSSGPSGMTSRSLRPGVSAPSAVYELSPSPASATGTKSFTWSSNPTVALLMQIK